MVLLFGYFSYLVAQPFLSSLVWAVVLSIVFYPLYTVLLKYVRWKSLAAIIILCIIFVIIAGPLSYLAVLLGRELLSLSAYLERGGITTIGDVTQHPLFQKAVDAITDLTNISQEQLLRTVTKNLSAFGRELAVRITSGVERIISVILNIIFMAVAVFFLLKDGPDLFKKILDSLPFAEEQKDKVVKRVKDITFSTMLGGVVIAVVQGLLGGIIFLVLGFSSPAVWGLVIAIVSFLTGIGHFVVWSPVAVYLLVQGEVAKGIGLIVAGILVLGMVDDFVRPYVIGSRTKMPFPVLFFSVIGGIKQFGLPGFILGPMSLVLFMSVMEVLRGIENDRRAEE